MITEFWTQSGWQVYRLSPFSWTEVGCSAPFDEEQHVDGDLVLYVNEGWRNEAMAIGLFGHTVSPDILFARLASVLPIMFGAVPHKIDIALNEGGYLTGIKASDFQAQKLSDEKFGHLDEHNARLKTILQQLAVLPGVEHIRIFGSLSNGKQVPGDVDLYVDLNALEADIEKTLSSALIRIAKEYCGLLDPFLDKCGVLYTRNDCETGWQKALGASRLRLDGRAGKTVDQVCVIDRPYQSIRESAFSLKFRSGV